MPQAQMKQRWRVAVLANIKDESLLPSPGLPSDAYAEYERIETIRLIRNAIE